ncbi:hypothetical protein [Sedimentibacter sp.]|uniref:hypothetical protein n=1 Tax=Sedimentibacter sp. TaxID=1960295 RepID=UPI0028AE177E|nr:hypothetical protein [Sedimentibacter sp.]
MDIYYTEEIDATIFTFIDCEKDNLCWVFNGNLLDKFFTGDILNLTFVEEYPDSNYQFETLDYLKKA